MAYEMAIDFITRICTLPLQLFPAGGDDVSILDNFTFCVNSRPNPFSSFLRFAWAFDAPSAINDRHDYTHILKIGSLYSIIIISHPVLFLNIIYFHLHCSS